jgi:hypothetical protein
MQSMTQQSLAATTALRRERTFQILRTIALRQKRTSVRYASGAPQEVCVALPEVT